MKDDQVVDYLRSRARVEPPRGLADLVMAGVDAAPVARSWYAPLLPAAATLGIVVVAVVAAMLVSRPPAIVAPNASATESGTPSSAFPIAADDPRFAECGGTSVEGVIAAFAFGAADYQRHFPNMGRSPELEEAGPAFAVVWREGVMPPGVSGGLARMSRPALSGHTLCIYVGQPPGGVRNFYTDVDIAGMRVELGPSAPATRPSPPPGYVSVEGLPITVLANEEADTLFSEVETCVSSAGYAVEYPGSWHTNAATRDTPACSWFAPEPFDGAIRPAAVKPSPEGVWVGLEVVDGSAGYTSITPIYMKEQVSIGGHQGHRAEFGPSTLEEVETRPEYRAYWYVVPLAEWGPTFIGRTNIDLADDYPLAKAVVDRIMASIRFEPD